MRRDLSWNCAKRFALTSGDSKTTVRQSTFHNTLLRISRTVGNSTVVSLSSCTNELFGATFVLLGTWKSSFCGGLLTPHRPTSRSSPQTSNIEILVFSIMYMLLFQKWVKYWGYPWSEFIDTEGKYCSDRNKKLINRNFTAKRSYLAIQIMGIISLFYNRRVWILP